MRKEDIENTMDFIPMTRGHSWEIQRGSACILDTYRRDTWLASSGPHAGGKKRGQMYLRQAVRPFSLNPITGCSHLGSNVPEMEP